MPTAISQLPDTLLASGITNDSQIRFGVDNTGDSTSYQLALDEARKAVFDSPISLTIATGAVTADAPVLDLSQTWNNAAVTFNGIKLNVTDTASAAASLLVDVQKASNSLLRLDKNGVLYIEGPNAAGANRQIGRLESHDYGSGNTANNIVLGAGTTGSPNIRLQVDSTSAHVGLNVGGTPYSAFTVMTDANGHGYTELRAADMQATGTGLFWRTVCDSDTNSGEISMWYGSTRRVRFNLPTTSNMALDARVDTANYAAIGVIGPSDTFSRISLGLDTGVPFMAWGPGNATRDLYLRRYAAGVLAQRNGTNAQAFVIYNTWTSDSNMERGFIKWAGNIFQVGADTVGGTARAMALQTAGTTRVTVNAAGGLAIADANDIAVGTTTGTKIGTATTEKLGFWGATPVVQQILATGGSATVDNVISLLQTLGLCKQS